MGFSKGYQVDDITDGLKQEASRYLKKEIILPEAGGLPGVIRTENATAKRQKCQILSR